MVLICVVEKKGCCLGCVVFCCVCVQSGRGALVQEQGRVVVIPSLWGGQPVGLRYTKRLCSGGVDCKGGMVVVGR